MKLFLTMPDEDMNTDAMYDYLRELSEALRDMSMKINMLEKKLAKLTSDDEV